MDVDFFKILIDTSLCVLIWIVQIVIYPGFCYYSEGDIKKWHPIYTRRITYIVLPLMLSQLIIYLYFSYLKFSYVSLGSLALVIFIWGVTFLVSVPLHAKIDSSSNSIHAREKLVKTNWIRTVAWTFLLILSLINYGV